MTVTFCGHAQISQSEKIENWLCDVTQKLIEQGATTFYLGGYGAFDSLAASVLRSQKKRYPQIERDRRKFCVIDVPRQYENLRLSQE